MILQRKLELARVSSLNALLLYPQARLYLPHLCGLRTHPQHVCTHTHTPTYSHTHTQEERPHPSQADGSTCPPVPAPRPPEGAHPLTSPLGFSLSYVAASPWAPRTPAPLDLHLPPAAALGSPSVRSRAQKTVRACARAASLLSRCPPRGHAKSWAPNAAGASQPSSACSCVKRCHPLSAPRHSHLSVALPRHHRPSSPQAGSRVSALTSRVPPTCCPLCPRPLILVISAV